MKANFHLENDAKVDVQNDEQDLDERSSQWKSWQRQIILKPELFKWCPFKIDLFTKLACFCYLSHTF